MICSDATLSADMTEEERIRVFDLEADHRTSLRRPRWSRTCGSSKSQIVSVCTTYASASVMVSAAMCVTDAAIRNFADGRQTRRLSSAIWRGNDGTGQGSAIDKPIRASVRCRRHGRAVFLSVVDVESLDLWGLVADQRLAIERVITSHMVPFDRMALDSSQHRLSWDSAFQ